MLECTCTYVSILALNLLVKKVIVGEWREPTYIVISMDRFSIYVHVHMTRTVHTDVVSNLTCIQIGPLSRQGRLIPFAKNALHSPIYSMAHSDTCKSYYINIYT